MADPQGELVPVVNEPMSLVPRNLTEAMEYAKLMASSELVPTCFRGKPADVLIAVQMGQELKLKPLQALSSIVVINGKPTLYGDGLLAVARGSGKCEWVDEKLDETTMTATCTVKRIGEPEPVVRTFSKSQAEKANLWQKVGPWQQYPKRMLQMRARTFALRDAFADVLKGVSDTDEVQDYESVGTTSQGAEIMMPRRKGAKAPSVEAFIHPEAPPAKESESAEVPKEHKAKAEESTATPNVWTGKVLKVGSKDGSYKDKKGNEKPYRLYKIHSTEEEFFGTFSETDADIARSAASSQCLVRIEFEQTQRGKELKNIVPLDAEAKS